MGDRWNKLTKLLLNATYGYEKKFTSAVEAFSNSDMSIEQIESIAKTLTPEYINQANKASL